MIIKTHLSEKDFINANIRLLYNKPGTWFIIAVAIFILLSTLYSLLFEPQYSSPVQIILPFAMLVWLPLITYFSAKKNYSTNKRVNEAIEYQFDNDLLSVKGESFAAQFTWDRLYRVSGTRNWLFIWQTKNSANVIPRACITDEQIVQLKKILTANKVKNNI